MNFQEKKLEIIEIGAVLLDSNLQIIDEFSKFVKPVKNPILTSFCKNLTKIKQEYVDEANIFENEIIKFAKWAEQYGEYTFTAWGGFDHRHIQRESEWKKITNPISKNNLNYKVRFAKLKNLKRRNGVGVRKALNIMNMQFEGTPHRAIYDTKNVVRIMQQVGL